MPHPSAKSSKRAAYRRKPKPAGRGSAEPRYSVGLPAATARAVEHYAQTIDSSMSKAIAALVRRGLESQQERKQEFFHKLRQNLTSDDPARQDQLIDEFRDLILGR